MTQLCPDHKMALAVAHSCYAQTGDNIEVIMY